MRLRVNNLGTPAGAANPITLSTGTTTTATFRSAPANMPVVSSPNVLSITVEPGTANEEIVHVTSYAANATAATVLRGQETTTARLHAGAAWVHAPTAVDFSLVAGTGVAITTTGGKAKVSAAQFYGPVPTGVAATDTANLQAALNAAATAHKTAVITQPGTFVVNATIIGKGSVDWGGTTQTIQATTGFPAGTPLVKATITGTPGRQTWTGSPICDANTKAAHAFVQATTPTKLTWVGNPTFQNATKTTVTIGGPYRHIGGMQFHRSSGHPQPKGYCSLKLNHTDLYVENIAGSGQETGIWNNAANNEIVCAHFANTGILQGYLDTGGSSKWIGCIGDSYKSVTHTGATGSSASTIITDATIKAIHQGIRVTGTNVPATSFVGTVTTGTSFKLVNKNNVSVLPTGAVAGITLTATYFTLRGAGGQIIGGLCEAAHTPSSAGDAFNVGHSVPTTQPYVIASHYVSGKNTTTLTFANTFAGSTTRVIWVGLIQKNVTTAAPTSGGVTSAPQTVYVDGYSTSITTTSTTSVMAGLGKVATKGGYTGFAYTPTKTGNVRIRITGLVSSKVALKNVTLQGYFSTGAAPTKGAAITGNAFVTQGAVSTRGVVAGTSGNNDFELVHMAKTQAIGTKLWIDIAFKTATAADAAVISNIVVEVDEITAVAQ